jgi:hypothetical protein
LRKALALDRNLLSRTAVCTESYGVDLIWLNRNQCIEGLLKRRLLARSVDECGIRIERVRLGFLRTDGRWRAEKGPQLFAELGPVLVDLG